MSSDVLISNMEDKRAKTKNHLVFNRN